MIHSLVKRLVNHAPWVTEGELDWIADPKSSSWVRAGLRKTLVDWGDERIERGPRGSPCG